MHSIDNVDYCYIFEINNTTMRGHRRKLKKQFCKTNCRKYSFSQRVINDWNSLPQTLVQTRNLNSFKSGIECFLTKLFTIYKNRMCNQHRIVNSLLYSREPL